MAPGAERIQEARDKLPAIDRDVSPPAGSRQRLLALGPVGQKVAAQRAADGDVNGGSVAHGTCPFAIG